jgi:hypothetical protein
MGMKLPNLSKTYIKNVKRMRKDYAAAKYHCLKLLESSYKIGMADEKTLKTLAKNLRLHDKDLNVGSEYWACSVQLRGLLDDQHMETFQVMNNEKMQSIFWDDRISDDNHYWDLPDLFY